MLTKREKEVKHLLMLGKSNKEIAQALCISEHTVKAHIEHIYAKYNIHSRLELLIKRFNDLEHSKCNFCTKTE